MTDTSSARASVVVVGGGYGGINVAKALDDVADADRDMAGVATAQAGVVAAKSERSSAARGSSPSGRRSHR